LASFWLWLKGYRILQRRYKTPVGEIDIIASKGKALVFVEVKRRRTEREGLEAITPRNRARIYRTAEFFLAKNPKVTGHTMRFDAMILSSILSISHLKNAWQENDCDFRSAS
jgi:putative endonuclease